MYLCAPIDRTFLQDTMETHQKAYQIAFSTLKKGINRYVYLLDEHFFAQYEYSPIKEASIQVEVELDKHERFFELYFNLSGSIRVECDRCSEYIDLPLQGEYDVVLKRELYEGQVQTDDGMDEDVIYLSPDAIHFDLAPLLYEFSVLSLPMQNALPTDDYGNPLCPPRPDGSLPCNQQTLAILKGKHAHETTEEEKNIDPRWAALKNLR